VFDHLSRTAFACISPRTDEPLFKDVCAKGRNSPKFTKILMRFLITFY
jgi:hypothetical protein